MCVVIPDKPRYRTLAGKAGTRGAEARGTRLFVNLSSYKTYK